MPGAINVFDPICCDKVVQSMRESWSVHACAQIEQLSHSFVSSGVPMRELTACKTTPPCMRPSHNKPCLHAHRSRRFRMPMSPVTPAAAAATPTPWCTTCTPRHCPALHAFRQLERSSGTRPSALEEGYQVQQGRKRLQRRAMLMLCDSVSRARYGYHKHVMICDTWACT